MRKQGSFRRSIICIVKCCVLMLSKVFFWKKNQRIWLIACGGDRWSDNADAFWLYMNKNHPEIKTIAVIKDRRVFGKTKKNWIKRNKLLNYILILRAEVLATTHTLSDVGPDNLIAISKAKKVWLQHGVIAIGKITASKAKSGLYDLICASSVREKDLMVYELGVNSEDISVTGLARHDVLKEKAEGNLDRNGILFIPTSRAWIAQTMKKEYEKMLFSWIEKVYNSEMNIPVKVWLHPG